LKSKVSPFQTRLLLAIRIFLVLVLAWQLSMPAMADPEQILKPDTPQLDNTVLPVPSNANTTSKKTLKGGVEHHEKTQDDHAKHLFSSTKKDQLQAQSAKAGLDFGILKSKTNSFSAQALSGIGVIGVKFIMGLGYPPIINRVFPGTPAEQVGLRPNDIIVAVDGIPTKGLTKQEVYDMIVGAPNTPVTVSIRRQGDFQARTMNRIDFNEITDPMVRRDYLMSL
jgi:C-terminal processing protease CtpA/Prc